MFNELEKFSSKTTKYLPQKQIEVIRYETVFCRACTCVANKKHK